MSASKLTTNKTPSIHTTIYVAPLTWPVTSLLPTTSSAIPIRRVTVTASVEKSVVKTVTVFTSTVTVRPRETKPIQPAKPELTEAILVMLEHVLAGGSRGVVFTEMWVMLPVKVDTTVDYCGVSNIGYKITDSSSSDRAWSPSISAKKGSNAFGMKSCKYEASTAGSGSISCDGASKMNCVKDPEYDKASKCYKGWEIKTCTPRMRCMLRK
ncbi:hypothetical protein CGRA01v4_13805 [Colletotrichum graminicola]|nr:hypothetical protein CGRA01v4_13805 [Colletotrichum graminicola]